MKNRVIVITGASSGIGAALAEHVGQQGARVVLVARREAELTAVAKKSGDALVAVADVTQRADVERALAQALEKFGHVDVWVNNAGRGISRVVSQITDEDFDEMMTTNVKSALYGMQAVLPHFKARGEGHIINVSSLLGRVPMVPIRSAYNASKHALNALTANLRMELRQEFPSIHVTTVSPGVVATEFGANARHGGPDSRKIPGAQPVEEVAAVIAEVIAKPRADVYTRETYKAQIVSYYAADDMGAAEVPYLPQKN
jgi:NADP-dependent 3-hydroxy acid dehydrogenase YdfG